MKNQTTHSPKGFALLFAVLVASVLLSIGMSIFNLTVKELLLSSSGRESQFSFYAADTGAECALYWDFKGLYIFATSTDNRVPSPASADCIGQNININPTVTVDPVSPNASSASTKFELIIPNIQGENSCATVTVSKSFDSLTQIMSTVVDSRGYNTCITTDPNRTERALRVSY